MNPLTRGIHKNLDSKSYQRMQNDFGDQVEGDGNGNDAPPLQGRLRLGRRKKTPGAAAAAAVPGDNHNLQDHWMSESSFADESNRSGWSGEFPAEFSSGINLSHSHSSTAASAPRHAGANCDTASHVSQDESLDFASGPTITRPSLAPPSHARPNYKGQVAPNRPAPMVVKPPVRSPLPSNMHNQHERHFQPSNNGPATIISTNTFDSMDQVEKPSITRPNVHKLSRNGMATKRMLSEKTINTINTINTQGTMNTFTTTGTGTHTATTADSTLRSSIASIAMDSVTANAILSSMADLSLSPAGEGGTKKTMTLSQVMLLQQLEQHQQDDHERMDDDQDDLDDPDNLSVSDSMTSPPTALRGMEETEEDRMMRLAMEVSLRDFEEQQRQELRLSNERKLSYRRTEAAHEIVDEGEEQVRERLHRLYRQSSQQSLLTISSRGEEFTEVLVENYQGSQRNRMSEMSPPAKRGQSPTTPSRIETTRVRNTAALASYDPSMLRQLEAARTHLSKEEADAIEQALMDAVDGNTLSNTTTHSRCNSPLVPQTQHTSNRRPPSSASPLPMPLCADPRSQCSMSPHLSASEAADIERAIREADEEEQRQSVNVALQLHAEEQSNFAAVSRPDRSSNARVTSEEIAVQNVMTAAKASPFSTNSRARHASDSQDGRNPFETEQNQHHNWNDTITRFNLEADTDSEMLDEAMLGCEADEDIAFVGNNAYNAFKQSTNPPNSKPTPAAVRKAAMESVVQQQIKSAIDNGLIEHCNGIVKEGDEAAVYHATQGEGSDGHDVAIKVFQRLKELKIRKREGQKVEYHQLRSTADATPKKEQLDLQAEKEYGNLIRASRALVPVASPLLQKENLVFMRFMGEHGWPAPQLKELELRKGSDTWSLLYSQIMVALRRLYVTARLVHADLNENNILVCPAYVVENKDEAALISDDENQVQAVFIDFAHAVDINHPQATALLERDVDQVRKFFVKKGITTLGRKMAMEFVTSPYPDGVDGDVKVDEPLVEEGMVSSANDSTSQPTVAVAGREPVSMITFNSSSTNASQSLGSGVLGEACEGALKQSFRTISSTSFSTKSSLSSLSSSKDKVALGLKSTSRGMSLNSASTNGTGITTESSKNETGKKEKKEKKLKKEKKEKKKKKESSKDSSNNSKRKSKEAKPEQNMSVLDHELFPIRTGSPDSLFDDAVFDDAEFDDAFENEKIEWGVEWNEDVFGGMKSI